MGRTPKDNRVQVGKQASHVIRNDTIDLSAKDFSRQARKHVGLLYEVYLKWAGMAENSNSHGGATWKNMNEWKREELMKEFFELYLI